MRNVALCGSLGFGLLIAMAGCEPVDDGASTRAKGWDGVLTDNVVPGDRDVFIDTDETMTVADGCAKTEIDALKVLGDYCASCHGDPATAQGLPPWDYVLKPEQMKTATWMREGQPPIKFLDVGKPETSAIYMRAAMSRDMPPTYDVGVKSPPKITYSGASVLREWIANCMQ
ncbi:MAG TPA: hypothetical protein VFH68_14275 [Polyangia bacterium]|jgi:hypothetical protein|nr:hypothetical protein [Polyangia bacterium]